MAKPRTVRVPPAPPVPIGACFMCRQPMSEHRACERCGGSGTNPVKRIFDREYGPCTRCDGFEKVCPLPVPAATEPAP